MITPEPLEPGVSIPIVTDLLNSFKFVNWLNLLLERIGRDVKEKKHNNEKYFIIFFSEFKKFFKHKFYNTTNILVK